VVEPARPKEVLTANPAPKQPAIKPPAFVFPMKTQYGRELIRAQQELRRYEVLHHIVAKVEPEIEEAEASKLLMQARWSSLVQGNMDTKIESMRLRDDEMQAEKIEAFIFRQPHPEWDSDTMHNFLIQRVKTEITSMKFDDLVHEIPKSEDLLEAEEKLEILLGG
jgi:hypothetical protein